MAGKRLACLLLLFALPLFAQSGGRGVSGVTAGLAAGGTVTGNITMGTNAVIFNGSQLVAQGVNILAQTNLANAQMLRVFNLTDSNSTPVNAEYGAFDWATTANTFTITTKGIGTGFTTRNLSIGPTGNAFLNFIANGSTIYTVNGNTLAPAADNTKDFGASNLRPRDVFAARSQNYQVGTAIASAATIAPVTPIVHVTGVVTVQTITAWGGCATSGNGCVLYIIPDGIFATNTAGNIALATAATVVGKTLIMTYDNATSKWYPSY